MEDCGNPRWLGEEKLAICADERKPEVVYMILGKNMKQTISIST